MTRRRLLLRLFAGGAGAAKAVRAARKSAPVESAIATRTARPLAPARDVTNPARVAIESHGPRCTAIYTPLYATFRARHADGIEADEPRKISPFDSMGLLDLIVNTGIANAINRMPEASRATGAIAETIENNVRSKIIKEHLNDPAYYDKMSALLDEIIAARKPRRSSTKNT